MTAFRLSRRSLFAVPMAAALWKPAGALASDDDFTAFLAGVRRDAVAQGIRAGTADYALRSAQYLPHVVELDHQHPEHTTTLEIFLQKVVTPQKIADGRAELSENWPLLTRVYQRF